MKCPIASVHTLRVQQQHLPVCFCSLDPGRLQRTFKARHCGSMSQAVDHFGHERDVPFNACKDRPHLEIFPVGLSENHRLAVLVSCKLDLRIFVCFVPASSHGRTSNCGNDATQYPNRKSSGDHTYVTLRKEVLIGHHQAMVAGRLRATFHDSQGSPSEVLGCQGSREAKHLDSDDEAAVLYVAEYLRTIPTFNKTYSQHPLAAASCRPVLYWHTRSTDRTRKDNGNHVQVIKACLVKAAQLSRLVVDY